MATILRRFLTLCILFLEGLKGKKYVTSVPSVRGGNISVRAISIDGKYEVEIFVQKSEFHQNYDRWFVASKKHTTYYVYSLVSNDAPTHLKEACQFQTTFPAFLPSMADEEAQQHYVLRAYVDILMQRMARAKGIPVEAA